MTPEEQTAEAVAKRLEGFKRFTLYARETVYYSKTVWAKDMDDAEEIANDECDWGNPVDYADFEVYDMEEEKE